MDYRSKPVVFYLIFFSFFLHSPSQTKARISPATSSASAPANSPLYEDVCKKTINYTFCLKTLESDPRAASASTMLRLGKIAFGLAIKDSIKTYNYISDLANSSNTLPELKKHLSLCFGEYDLVHWCFRSCYLLIETDPSIANYNSLNAADHAGFCENYLKVAKAHIEKINTGIENTKCFSNIGNVITTAVWDSSLAPASSN